MVDAQGSSILNRELVLLGIKYESAVLAGLDETRLLAIEEQIKEEAGDGWEINPAIIHGRKAARDEKELETPKEPRQAPGAKQNPSRKSLFSRWLKS